MKKLILILSLIVLQNVFAQSTQKDSIPKPKYYLQIDGGFGVINNKTFGTIPTVYFGTYFGKANTNDKVGFILECSIGKSQKLYNLNIQETQIRTDFYDKNFIGLAIFKDLYNHKNFDLYANINLGLDTFEIEKGGKITHDLKYEAFAYEIAIGNHFFIKRFVPEISLVYHYSNIENNSGTPFNKNYWGIRFTFGVISKKQQEERLQYYTTKSL